jgi:hypothetical protein
MRRAVFVAVVLAAGAVAAALALLLLGDGGAGSLPGPGSEAVTAETAIDPQAHLFGDEVSARVDALVDTALLDPAAVRLEADFDPYEPVGPVVVERRDLGELTRLRFTVQLRCLGSDCVPELARRPFALRPGALVAEGRRVATLQWPELEVTSRVAQSALTDGAAIIQVNWRANMTELPAATYRVTPRVAAAALAGTGGMLAAGAMLLLVAALRRPRREGPPLPPLERALVLLEAARRSGDAEEQRRALDLVAAELLRGGEEELAGEASTLAWSRPRPEPGETELIHERVAALVEARRNGHGP